MSADDWSGAFESDATAKKPIDEATQTLFQFVQSHETTLREIDAANLQDLLHCAEEALHKPVSLFSESLEDKVLPQDLFLLAKRHALAARPHTDSQTDTQSDTNAHTHTHAAVGFESGEEHVEGELPLSPYIRKILAVLVYLVDEVAVLREVAENKFFRPLQVFGQPPVDDVSGESSAAGPNTPTGPAGHAASEKLRLTDTHTHAGEREKMIGAFLPLLVDLLHFTQRCQAVCVNLVQQLSAIYHPTQQPLFRSLFAHVRVSSAVNAVGELLAVLLSLDAIIEENSALREAWDAYKAMVGIARADTQSFKTDAEALSALETMCVAIDQGVLCSRAFEICIEQDFEQVSLSHTHTHTPAESERESESVTVDVRSNQRFVEGELLFALKQHVEQALPQLHTPQETRRTRERLLEALCLYALHRRLMPAHRPPDTKLYRQLWAIQKSVPSLCCVGDAVLIHINEFLIRYCALSAVDPRKLDPAQPALHRSSVYLAAQDAALPQRVSQLRAQCQAWMVLAESRLQPFIGSEAVRDAHGVLSVQAPLELFIEIFTRGVSLAQRVHSLAQNTLLWHTTLQMPLSRTHALSVALLLETLKALKLVFTRKMGVLAEFRVHMLRAITQRLHAMLVPMENKLVRTQQRLNEHAVWLSDVVRFLSHLLGSGESFLSVVRRAAILMSVELLVTSARTNSATAPLLFKNDKETQRFWALTQKLCEVCELEQEMARSTDTAFMYFHVDLLPLVLQELYASPTEGKRLPYILAVFDDGVAYSNFVQHLTDTSTQSAPTQLTRYSRHYRAVLLSTLHAYYTRPLCVDVENDLRVHTHTKQLDHMHTVNPKTENLRPLRPYLLTHTPRLTVCGVCVDIVREVTHYLNTTFYNLTTVALHDWRTYTDMRQLALDKYGLQLKDHFLPMGSLDQGLDVLQIMRNIHIFVSRFTYNMNAQVFIEYKGDANKASKHCNTIQISSIAASIRQHGLGVLNTAVNYTYQFLASKFRVFSQFLFDDYIKAYLSREHRWFKKNKHTCNNVYPFERALSFVKEIRKLGVNEAHKSFLDQFRMLITEIGNALGYVRMVRSASMRYCAEAVKYLPTLSNTHNNNSSSDEDTSEGKNDDLPCFAEHAKDTVSGETLRAARNLDEVVATLLKNFGEGSDYFKVLVSVFQNVLIKNAEHDHLKYFYIIVPAMCISWIDASLVAKEAMHKIGRANTNMREMYFTDDGFAMGVAYCLAILKQTRRHEGLHWEESIALKMKEDAKNLKIQQQKRAEKEAALAKQREEKAKRRSSFFGFGTSKKTDEDDDIIDTYQDEEEIHTLQTTAKRLEAFRRESEQLFYSMSGATIFFKRTDVDT